MSESPKNSERASEMSGVDLGAGATKSRSSVKKSPAKAKESPEKGEKTPAKDEMSPATDEKSPATDEKSPDSATIELLAPQGWKKLV